MTKPYTPCKAVMVAQNGLTHLMSPIGGAEHTLCGISYDAYLSEGVPSLQLTQVQTNIVTCPECALVILACRNARLKSNS